ncbi:MAG TPA: shikimate dehydrogenase [Jatrophihabitans sp.]|jgi:shikimate dehydrogenase
MRHCAVLGKPIAHSLSPVLHNAAYAALGLDWSYGAIECDEDDLRAVLAARRDWAGFSCTMPLKRAILDIADEVRPVAAAVGAGNTLLPGEDGGWIADNTDVAGIVASLAEHAVRPDSATILGAGGTAQAVVAALVVAGAQRVTLLVRDVERTAEIRATAQALGVYLEVEPLAANSPAFLADLIISTLPAGAADAYADQAWTSGQAVLDVVYGDRPTRLAAVAAESGATVVSGALMLLHQAATQVELMTGLQAPVAQMRVALAAAVPSAGL